MTTQTYISQDTWQNCYGLAHKLTNNEHDAEDIAQEVMLKLHEKGHDHVENPRSYALQMVRNAVIDRARGRTSQERVLTVTRNQNSHYNNACPSIIAEQTETRSMVTAALNLLPAELHGPVVAHHYDALSRRENAQLHKLTVSGVKARLSSARARLRTYLADHAER